MTIPKTITKNSLTVTVLGSTWVVGVCFFFLKDDIIVIVEKKKNVSETKYVRFHSGVHELQGQFAFCCGSLVQFGLFKSLFGVSF